MKTLKITSIALVIAVFFSACGKSGTSPQKAAATVPLITQVVNTYPQSNTVFNYTYDDQKRLSAISGASSNALTYNAGGFVITIPQGNGDNLITAVTLTNGRIEQVLCYHSASGNSRFNSVFSYDTKGRLIGIAQTETYFPGNTASLNGVYTWDDNDNLTSYVISAPGASKYSETYSGFSADNPNTLRGKNFGLDYFGAADYWSFPFGDNKAGPNTIFPAIYPGKLLPTTKKIISGNYISTYTNTYKKNAAGSITRMESTNTTDASDHTIIDIAYQ